MKPATTTVTSSHSRPRRVNEIQSYQHTFRQITFKFLLNTSGEFISVIALGRLFHRRHPLNLIHFRRNDELTVYKCSLSKDLVVP